MKIRELNDFSIDELIEEMDNNPAFHEMCREIADGVDTEWTLAGLLRNVPRCIAYNIGYPGDYMTLKDRNGAKTAAEWINELDDEYSVLNGAKLDEEKIAYYCSVLDADDFGEIFTGSDNYVNMDSWVFREIGRGLDAVLAECKCIKEQFDDPFYLADCLLSCELLDDFYKAGGEIYRRCGDMLVA